jgi:hypothetical protein
VVLNDAQLRELLGELRAEMQAPPAGVDVAGIEAFADLIERRPLGSCQGGRAIDG